MSSFCRLTKSIWYCTPPDTVGKIESLWDSWSFKWWFKSYLSNHNQYGFESGHAAINCGISQGSVLGPLLFLLYINGLNQSIKFCKVHHFADDTNLLCLINSIKNLNKLVNADWKQLVNWLNANKISLSVKKPWNCNL